MIVWKFGIAAALVLGVALPTAANSQAFGVRMGAPVSDYGGYLAGTRRGYYYKITPPQPNSEFDFYSAFATPETGICKVSGIGKDYTNDAYGSKTKAAFANIKAALVSKYGSSTDYDFLHAGAIWKAANEWNWSIYKNERSLSSYWLDASSLPAGVATLGLNANAVQSSAAYIVLNYEFTNFQKCLDIMKQSDSRGL